MSLRPRRTLACAGALFGVLLLGTTQAAWAQAPESSSAQAQNQRSPSEAAAEVRARGGYGDEVQHVGPGGGGPTPFPSGGGGADTDEDRLNGRRGSSDIQRYDRGQDFDNVDVQEDSSGLDLSLPSAFGRGLGYLMMVIAGVGLLALIVVLVMTFWPKGARLDPAPLPSQQSPRAAVIDTLPWNPGDPNELARAGRYAEAIVALLVREHERARTAREVLRALAELDSRRDPLTHVVRRAEHVRFAGVEATLELYEEVRALVDEVLRAPVSSAPVTSAVMRAPATADTP